MLRWAFLLLLAGAALAQAPRSEPLVGPVNSFPQIESAEAIRGQPKRVRFDFRIFFSVDENRYVPIQEDLAALLSTSPEIRSRGDIRVRVLATECRPLTLTWMTPDGFASATGGLVTTEVEITPGRSLEAGAHELVLAYPMIDMGFRAIESSAPPPAPAEVRLRLQVWASEAARQEVIRRAQEEKRQQEIRQRASELRAQEAERKRQEIAARETSEKRLRIFRRVAAALGLFLLLGLPVYLKRQWIRPKIDVTVLPGGHVQLARFVPAASHAAQIETGTILETTWARSFLGRRQRIKIEVLAGEGHKDPLPRLDLLVSVGRSVHPGRYLAPRGKGGVWVQVTQSGPG